jgi:hypothetical protein
VWLHARVEPGFPAVALSNPAPTHTYTQLDINISSSLVFSLIFFDIPATFIFMGLNLKILGKPPITFGEFPEQHLIMDNEFFGNSVRAY